MIVIVCLTVLVFPNITSSQTQQQPEYDPWVDYNDDGKIDHKDLLQLAAVYGTSGIPINKTALLLELLDRVEALEERVSALEGCFDADGDGFDTCNPGDPGDDGQPADCDDSDPTIYPGATEICDGIDNDCDGQIDEGDPEAMCGSIPHGHPECVAGVCAIDYCDATWYDVNGVFADGCECQEDTYDQAGSGDTCAESVYLGTFTDTQADRMVISANIVPTGDVDWYRFFADDGTDILIESFYVRVRFITNPGDNLRFMVYKDSCNNLVYDGTDFIESGTFTINDSAYYYVKVYQASGMTMCSSYQLEISNGYYS